MATTLTRHTETGAGQLGTAMTERVDAAEQVYLAPEAFSVEDPDGIALDVFSLGALAHLLLTGQPPAADLTEREAILAAHGALAVEAAADRSPAHWCSSLRMPPTRSQPVGSPCGSFSTCSTTHSTRSAHPRPQPTTARVPSLPTRSVHTRETPSTGAGKSCAASAAGPPPWPCCAAGPGRPSQRCSSCP